ncbi:hypothetical protein KR018_004035 [Drosophila ironensis]|nr:hypothetical protein KR018_004035 [Drosophila ironensis]
MLFPVDVLVTVALFWSGTYSQNEIHFNRLTKLNDVVTTRIKNTLTEYNSNSHNNFNPYYTDLQIAVKLPIMQLDSKIMTFNNFSFFEREDSSLTKTNENMHGGFTRQGFNQFEKKILKLLKKIGIYDNFTVRVFKAIFSDEDQLKKLKNKLDKLGLEDGIPDCDSLWDFIIYLF